MKITIEISEEEEALLSEFNLDPNLFIHNFTAATFRGLKELKIAKQSGLEISDETLRQFCMELGKQVSKYSEKKETKKDDV